ncbi:hypothetical protein [Azospirillum halopraeferens]|uniref:hypothetical protein n=1 Tax=Azospirillum halopraeferens TaxID=34010 RepID=UPI00041F294D|nr:hypothetical protein [Azospirillum halopraeferens]
MAEILTLPRTPEADARLAEQAGHADATRDAAGALADLRRMMAFHAETRRHAEAFERLCHGAAAGEPAGAGVVVLPVVLSPTEPGQRCA